MLTDDLGVFYAETDFAHRCTRERPGEDDAVFSGILATVDQALFNGNMTAGVHQVRYPTAAADLAEGDIVRTQQLQADGSYTEPEAWRVLRTPDRVNDGAESLAYLTPDPEA